MPKLSLEEIVRAVNGRVIEGTARGLDGFATGFAFDTRQLKPGDLFFALKGEHRDGHEFVGEACAAGAVGAVVATPAEHLPARFVQIGVNSPLEALQQLARHVRRAIDIPVIAISGSNGKTSTKEMLAHVLGTRMVVHKSPGNFNNHIGVPLSILSLDPSSQILVVELASNHQGEIRKLAEIARPQVGLVTNIGRAHLGFFGDLKTIAREKTDVLRCLEPAGKGVVNADDAPLLAGLGDLRMSLVKFAVNEPAEFRATEVRQLGGEGCTFRVGGIPIRLKTPGIHNVYNALGALAAASQFGIPVKEGASALEGFQPVRLRMNRVSGITLMDDSYNSNPDSVRAALSVLSGMEGQRKVFIMGEMLELGEQSAGFHREIGRLVPASGIQLLVGIGGQTRLAVEEARAHGMGPKDAVFFQTKAEARDKLRSLIRPDDVVLVKGSRLTGLEEICDFLRHQMVEGRT